MQNQEQTINKLTNLLQESIKKNVSNKKQKIGLLFSGGLDSSLLALLLKKFKVDFTCYVAEFYSPNFKQANDIKYSKLLAKQLNLKLKIVKVNIKEVEKELPKIIQIIKRNEVPMVSIATAIYFCMKQIKSDKIKIVFYDCACDCVFAGLQKHRISKNLNQTCIDSLKSTYKTDLPRDTAIAKYFGIKLYSPFLDKKLTDFALKLPKKYKIQNEIDKYILRKTAVNLGLLKKIAFRKKRAIQYSSNSQKLIKKISKKHGYRKIKDYLDNITT